MAYFARGIGNGSCKKADELAQAHRRCGWSPEPSERVFCVFDRALVNDHVGAAPIFADLRESCGTDSARCSMVRAMIVTVMVGAR